jgi:hypothetical protein
MQALSFSNAPSEMSSSSEEQGTRDLRLLNRFQHRVDVGQHATVRDGDPRQQPAELLVIADGEEEVVWDDAVPLVVTRRVAGQLEDLSGEVDGGARAHACRVPPDAANGELQPRLDGPRHRHLLWPIQLPPRRRLLHLAAVHPACFRFAQVLIWIWFVCEPSCTAACCPPSTRSFQPVGMGVFSLDLSVLGWVSSASASELESMRQQVGLRAPAAE